MTTHIVKFKYVIPEDGDMDLDMDPTLTWDEKEQIAEREIVETFPDIEDLEVLEIKEVD